MTVDEMLRRKGCRIVSIDMKSSASVAAKLLRSEDIGAVVVKDSCHTEGDVVLGMLSERDILEGLVNHGARAMTMPVMDLMTRKVVRCGAQDGVGHVAELMRRHNLRHVLVMDREALIGVVSIRDLLAEHVLMAAD